MIAPIKPNQTIVWTIRLSRRRPISPLLVEISLSRHAPRVSRLIAVADCAQDAEKLGREGAALRITMTYAQSDNLSLRPHAQPLRGGLRESY
jgi:hypothetical protein